jgi:prevent-host-death family protein
MKSVSISKVRANPAKLWNSPDGSETVITVRGKPKAVVIPAGDDVELVLKSIRRAKAQMAVKRLQAYAVESGLNTLTDEEIEREISEARKSRS